jgi:hypothetical protein
MAAVIPVIVVAVLLEIYCLYDLARVRAFATCRSGPGLSSA